MNPQVVRAAHEAWKTLGDDQKTVKSLPGQLRTMGLVATLEWLSDKKDGKRLAAALLAHLKLNTLAELEGQLSSVAFLAAMRRAAEFSEALHLVARAQQQTTESQR